MMKKIALLFNVLLFAGVFFFSVFRPDGAEETRTLKRGALAGEVRQAEKIMQSLPQGMGTENVRLCFRGEELACDREKGTWYLPVDMDSEEWEDGEFSDADESVHVLPLEDYTLLDKKAAVADGRAVPLLVWSEDASSCAAVNVVFTGLAVVRIETDADLDIDTVFAGSVVFYEPCGKEDWVFSSVFEAHERGQTTRAYPKKGYRLNLVTVTSSGISRENPAPVLGMRSSDSWIFYAIYSDGTKIRDKFNIELWNRFGAVNTPYDEHYGTHMEYAELFVNGEYRGMYGIMEPVDSSQLAIGDQEYLYKRTFGRELLPELFDEAKPEDYLTVLGMEIKGKDGAGTRADWQCFRRYAELAAEPDDEIFAKEAGELFDIGNMTDIWLYFQMFYGEDNIYKNMFFAFKREGSDYRLYLVPWDVDLSWGNGYADDAELLYVKYMPERAGKYLQWPLADRLLSLNAGDMRSRAAARWKELRQDILSDESMDALMEDCIHRVQDSGAFARDAARWPDSSHDGNYGQMRAFMKERLDMMDKMIENPDEWRALTADS